MKAIVIERPRDVALREISVPAVGPRDVLVETRSVGVCRTDYELITGELDDPRWVRFPCVPGHEWSGVVSEVGGDVTSVVPGDRVVGEGMVACLHCGPCRRGDTHLCENYDQIGFTRGGGCGEYVLAPERTLHQLPDHVSFDTAVLIEPGSVVLRGIEKLAPQPGEVMGVIGIGTLGSIAIKLLRLHSPVAIVAYGLRDAELEFARELGADHVINVAEGDPVQATTDLVGRPLDVVIETAGAVAALELATRLPREGGRVLALGLAGAGRELTIPADRFVFRDLTLIGSVTYTTASWARMVGLVSDRLVELDSIVTHRFPLERYPEAFALMEERVGNVVKIVLQHERS
ncbi:MAG TPA: alcohol dehydrogenase catalytic domain-containing protein [Gaiellaceae bacterium]